MQKLQERLAASRFFTFSLLLHIVLVVLGGSVVLFNRYTDAPDFTSDGGALVSGEPSIQPPQEQAPDLTQEQAPTPEAPSISAPSVSAITTTAMNNTTFAMAPIQPKITAISTDSKISQPTAVTGRVGTGVPGAMAGRMGGTARGMASMKMGGKEKSEKAVMAGLRWLKEHQNEDGSWSNENKPAMTGLALLSFLGHGELPESPEFGPTVKKAIDWLLSRGQEFQGRMSLTKDGWGGNHGVYEHGIATYAMGEYYSMTKDERFVELLKQAVGYIVNGQTPLGGWDYGYAKGVRNDLSVAGWQIQALKAAHLTGLGIPGVDESLDKAMGFIKQMQGNEGGFGYTKASEQRPSLTGVGVLCTYFWKQDKDKVVKQGIEYLLGKADVDYQGNKADLYEWYYNTQACLMFGGSAWTKWNRMFQDEIADAQSPDGSWPKTGGKGHKENDAGIMGQTYRTTLCILMLEVFYRYMPINK